MNLDEVIHDPKVKKAAVTFAAGYAKQMMEGQYTRLFQSGLGKSLMGLSRPSKLAVEAALNLITAYLATREGRIANTPVKEFLWEIAKDAPSELSRRLLNGEVPASERGGMVVNVAVSDRQMVLEGLLRMEVQELEAFLGWLEHTSPGEREEMARSIAYLSEQQQRKLMSLPPEKARSLLALSQRTEPVSPRETSATVKADIAARVARLRAARTGKSR